MSDYSRWRPPLDVREGLNELAPPPAPSLVQLFVRHFKSPLIISLIAAAAIALGLGHRTDAGFKGVVLIINALIGTVQESRAAQSWKAPPKMIGQTATVCRGGVELLLNARDVVVGDIVVL